VSACHRGKKEQKSVHLHIPNIHLKIKPAAPLPHRIKIPTAREAEEIKIFCATFLCLLLVPVKLNLVFEKKKVNSPLLLKYFNFILLIFPFCLVH